MPNHIMPNDIQPQGLSRNAAGAQPSEGRTGLEVDGVHVVGGRLFVGKAPQTRP